MPQKEQEKERIKFLKEAELDSSGHIFVPNSESLVNVQLMSALQVLKLQTPLITYDTWLTAGNNSLEQLERQNVSFIFPDFIDPERPEVQAFNEIYKNRVNILPSKYAFIGYDLVSHFANILGHPTGTEAFQTILTKVYCKGATMSGYYFNNNPDNQVVPIYKLEGGQLILKSLY